MLYNLNNGIGKFFEAANQVTGSLFLTLIIITLVIMLIVLACGIPVEFSLVFLIPFHLAVLSYSGEWMSVAGSFLIFGGLIFAKNFLF